MLKVEGTNSYQEYIAVNNKIIQAPHSFTTCDSCQVLVWMGDLVHEVCLAPGQTVSQDGRGFWQGALTCTQCSLLTVAAFKMVFKGACLECGLPFLPNHICESAMPEEEQKFRSQRFWEMRELFLEGPQVHFQAQAVERAVIL